MKLLIILIFLLSGTQLLAQSLLSQKPRAYNTYAGFKSASSCSGLIKATRSHLLKLKKQGHQVAMIFNNGTGIPLPRHRIKDSFNGRTYSDISSLIEAMEDRARRKTRWSKPKDFKDVVKDCLRGRRLKRQHKKVFPESCTKPLYARHLHSGFAILNPGTQKEPYIIHLYGDEAYDFLKASIRVETLDSYLEESKMQLCESKISTLKNKAQSKIINFLKNNHAQRLLASGNRSFNLITNPWDPRTQNCNAWTSEVLASALFTSKSRWKSSGRARAQAVMRETDYRPFKVVGNILHSLARLPTIFIDGVNMEEGNVNHFYGVADIVPTEVIEEWLNRNGQITSTVVVEGTY